MVAIGFIRIGNRYIPFHEITLIAIEMKQAYIWTDNEDGKYTYITTSEADVNTLREWIKRQDILCLTEAKERFD